jgi:hypothetical protein
LYMRSYTLATITVIKEPRICVEWRHSKDDGVKTDVPVAAQHSSTPWFENPRPDIMIYYINVIVIDIVSVGEVGEGETLTDVRRFWRA